MKVGPRCPVTLGLLSLHINKIIQFSLLAEKNMVGESPPNLMGDIISKNERMQSSARNKGCSCLGSLMDEEVRNKK